MGGSGDHDGRNAHPREAACYHSPMHDAQAPDLDWRTIDLALIDLARRQGALDRELGPWLLLAQREGVHRALGFGCFEEYVARRFGYDPRTAREKVRVARALEALPSLAELLQTGARSWSLALGGQRVRRLGPHLRVASETYRGLELACSTGLISHTCRDLRESLAITPDERDFLSVRHPSTPNGSLPDGICTTCEPQSLFSVQQWDIFLPAR